MVAKDNWTQFFYIYLEYNKNAFVLQKGVKYAQR